MSYSASSFLPCVPCQRRHVWTHQSQLLHFPIFCKPLLKIRFYKLVINSMVLKRNQNSPLPLIIIYALEVIHTYYIHTVEILQRCAPVHLFPTLWSVMTCWQLKDGNDGSIYTKKLANTTIRAFLFLLESHSLAICQHTTSKRTPLSMREGWDTSGTSFEKL